MLPAELSQKYSVYIRSFVTLLTRHYQVRAEAGLRKTFTIPPHYRVRCRVLLHSERIVLLRSFKERNVILHSFFEFLATYETPKEQCVLLRSFLKNAKNATFICKERTHKNAKNAKNATFICKERKRTQANACSFEKNAKEHKRTCVLL